jgi:hypothetical protein
LAPSINLTKICENFRDMGALENLWLVIWSNAPLVTVLGLGGLLIAYLLGFDLGKIRSRVR